jgi:hypothetical protein
MVGRDVEHLEVGDVVLDLGAFVRDEAELLEDARDLGHALDARVERATTDGTAGERDVDGLRDQPGRQLAAADVRPALSDGRLDGDPDRVRDGPDLRAVLGRQRTDPAEHAGQAALLAQHVELDRVERRGIGRGRDRGQGL